MHEELWAGVDLKLAHAQFHYIEMGHSLIPPERTSANVAIESVGAIIGMPWHRAFYAHLDAFLSATRSVAEVIKCCFGHDRHRQMADWWDSLQPEERDRRDQFSGQFQKHYNAFASLPLSTARHISEHRTGYPDVTVTINGMFGVTYMGGPTKQIPMMETSRNMPPFVATHNPLRPKWSDFKIDGRELFNVCSDYLGKAASLRTTALAIAQQIHGCKHLTPPT